MNVILGAALINLTAAGLGTLAGVLTVWHDVNAGLLYTEAELGHKCWTRRVPKWFKWGVPNTQNRPK